MVGQWLRVSPWLSGGAESHSLGQELRLPGLPEGLPFFARLARASSHCRPWDVPTYKWAGAPPGVDSVGPVSPGCWPLSRPVIDFCFVAGSSEYVS